SSRWTHSPERRRKRGDREARRGSNESGTTTVAFGEGAYAMKRHSIFPVVALLGVLSMLAAVSVEQVCAQTVFQTAGPTPASIQGAVDAFRAALGDPNNLNAAGPLGSGRREINWDGGSTTNLTTTDPVTPFNVFLNTRGAQFTTPGKGLSQGPPSGGPQGGLAVLFDNPTYGTIFKTFSPSRLFTPVGSRITEGFFFVPGSNGTQPATVTGFGAVFTDVDKPNGTRSEKHSTTIEYFDTEGRLLFFGPVPSAPGDGNLAFFGVVF